MRLDELIKLEEKRKALEEKRGKLKEFMENVNSITLIRVYYATGKTDDFPAEEVSHMTEKRIVASAMKEAELIALEELIAGMDEKIKKINDIISMANEVLMPIIGEEVAKEPETMPKLVSSPKGQEQYEEGKYYPSAHSGASFHGESWYSCPHCNNSIEAYDFEFERGVKKVAKGVYRCNKCKKLMSFER